MQPWSQPLLWKGAAAGAAGTDPYLGRVVLLMGYEGVNGSTGAPGMTDESPAAHGTATATGATISTAQSKFGSSSLNTVSASSGRITFPTSTDWVLGTAYGTPAMTFTIECWVRFNTITFANQPIILANWNTAGTLGWEIYVASSGNLTFSVTQNGTTILGQAFSAWSPTTGVWYNIAVDSDGLAARAYVNGVFGGSSGGGAVTFNPTQPLSIGSDATGSTRYLDGWVDEVRITKGYARYANVAGFTAPTTAYPRTVTATDPNFSSVVLLLGFEGPAGSPGSSHATMDESPNCKGAAPTVGGATIDTTIFKWGTSSIQFTPTPAGLSWNASTDWDFGAGNFTVECWVRFNTVTGTQNILGIWGVSNKFWNFSKSSTGQLSWHVSTNGTTDTAVVDATWGPTTGTWYHIAVDWDGTKTRVYANGVMLGSNVTAYTISASQPGGFPMTVADRTANGLNGWLDDVRVTKGVARYHNDSGFTVPSAAFPRS
jgi:hypothetical protein